MPVCVFVLWQTHTHRHTHAKTLRLYVMASGLPLLCQLSELQVVSLQRKRKNDKRKRSDVCVCAADDTHTRKVLIKRTELEAF